MDDRRNCQGGRGGFGAFKVPKVKCQLRGSSDSLPDGWHAGQESTYREEIITPHWIERPAHAEGTIDSSKINVPREEYLGNGSPADRFPTPAIFPKY